MANNFHLFSEKSKKVFHRKINGTKRESFSADIPLLGYPYLQTGIILYPNTSFDPRV